jgi:hypothetical protein
MEERGVGDHGSHVSGGEAEGGLISRQFGGEVGEPVVFARVIGGEVV